MMITTEVIKRIGKRSLILDSNFLLNTLHSPDEYYPIYQFLKDNKVKIITTNAVEFEIYKGSATKEIFNIKKEFLRTNVDEILPIHEKSLIADSEWMVFAFRHAGKRLSLTDLIISGTLKQYNKDVILLTADIGDFPKTLFDWEGIVNVELEFKSKKDKADMCSKIDTYVLVSFSEEKYKKALENFNKSK